MSAFRLSFGAFLVLAFFLGGVSCVVFSVLFLFCGCVPPPFPPLAVVVALSFLLAALRLSCVVLFSWGGASFLVLSSFLSPSPSVAVGSGVSCGASCVFRALPSSSSPPLWAVVLCLVAAAAVVVGWSRCGASCRGVSSFWCGSAVLGSRSSRSFVARGIKNRYKPNEKKRLRAERVAVKKESEVIKMKKTTYPVSFSLTDDELDRVLKARETDELVEVLSLDEYAKRLVLTMAGIVNNLRG